MLTNRNAVLGILQSMNALTNQHSSMSFPEIRRALRNELTVRMDGLDEPTVVKIEALLASELETSGVTDAADLPRLGKSNVSLWQDHPCIDNAIHNAAGPRLRAACKAMMHKQGHAEQTGHAKITAAFCLPCGHVLHTVGPIFQGKEQPQALSSCYTSCLDLAAKHGITSIAFCCISTGVFGYPQQAAAQVAMTAVKRWLDATNSGMQVVFNTFLPQDTKLYSEMAPPIFDNETKEPAPPSAPLAVTEELSIALAGRWLADAEAVLICAGAGMSAQAGYDVYVNEADFARHYPELRQYGYRTSYECMGLMSDGRVPVDAKWRYQAQHMKNMRYTFPPNMGHTLLLDMVRGREHFVWTSNVDGCFERAGFDRQRVYTPQGEWAYYQCKAPCRPDSVFPAREMLDRVINSRAESLPACPRCGGEVFGNVRGGGWFLHREYDEASRRVEEWLESVVRRGLRLVIVEVGAGFNTPTVTRFPMESLAIEHGNARMIRINPAQSEVPAEVPRALSFKRGWEVLHEIKESSLSEPQAQRVEEAVVAQRRAGPSSHVTIMRQRSGHFDWRVFLSQLRD